MRPIDAAAWAKNRGDAPPTPAELHPKGQVVAVAPGNQRIAKDAQYLAETNNRVDKQTRAREQSQKYSVAAPRTTAAPEQMPAAQGRSGGLLAQAANAAPRTEELTGFGGARPSLSALMQQASKARTDSQVRSLGEGAAQSGDGEQSSASEATHGADVGGAAPNDLLDGVEASDSTYLNTREWKFASFFNRVKQAVSAKWDPNGRLRAKDPTGRRTGLVDRTTVLHVALRPDGTLADVFVAKPSGLDELDQEAMASFDRAQPFANPPPALVEDGFIRFAFTFTVSHEGMSLPRMFGFGR